MASIYQEGGRGRPLGRFIEVDGKPTRRPSSHTDRADRLGLEKRRHPLRGKGHTIGDYTQGSEWLVVDGRDLRVRLPRKPKPLISERVQIADGLEVRETPRISREVMVVDFSAGVDEAVLRTDAFEGKYMISHEVFKKPAKRDWVKEVVGRARDNGRSFVRDVRMGMDTNLHARVRRSSRAGA